MISRKNKRAMIVIAAIGGGILTAALLVFVLNPSVPEGTIDPDEMEGYQPSGELHEDIIITPPATGLMRTELRDVHGDPIGVACSTCHGDGNLGDPPARNVDELDEFHLEMEFDHGELSCSSCHATNNRDKLQLADSTHIDYEDSMQMCAQCHSSTYRSYEHGAHGGMTGHWDTSKGPRTRNHCLVCHDAHKPAFRPVTPAAPPRDRFFNVD